MIADKIGLNKSVERHIFYDEPRNGVFFFKVVFVVGGENSADKFGRELFYAGDINGLKLCTANSPR